MTCSHGMTTPMTTPDELFQWEGVKPKVVPEPERGGAVAQSRSTIFDDLRCVYLPTRTKKLVHMKTNTIEERIIALLQETGKAHHQAFHDTNGFDPGWPLWYSEFIHEKLKELLGANFTRSELIHLIIEAQNEQQVLAPGSDWQRFYANFFAERYK